MPELPEVETLRLQLSNLIIGQTIKNIKILKNKSFIGNPALVIGAKLKNIRRFAKILILDLSNDFSLAIHLKLSGQLIYRGSKEPKKLEVSDPLLYALPNKHTRVIISFFSGDNLYFNDLRIFGWIKVVQTPKVKDVIEHLGPEPFKDLTIEKFEEILSSSRKPVKLVLMDQEKIAGVGNIYANEALFLARVHPETPANKIAKKTKELLYLKLLKSLKDGIRWGGASENNFRDAYGRKGKLQEHFLVYGKEGEDCPNKCGEKIKRISLAGRGTFFCPHCQKKDFD